MTKLVFDFNELTDGQMSAAGGKGSSLARMYQAGLPVPEGLVILPSAFDGDDLMPESWQQLRACIGRMRETYGELAFAVRSSALSEDSAEASFAGEFESVLNVQTDEEMRSAILRVYQSRRSERVQTYTRVKGMDITHDIAVVVQRLVLADSSGVLFTCNPITGERDQMMINAAWGLGESIVQGVVTPDTMIVNKQTGAIVRRDTTEKQMMTVRIESGTEEQPVPDHLRRTAVLTDKQAGDLMRLGAQIEAFFGMPMDVEWVLADGVFTIVQARPITALPDPEQAHPKKWKLPKGMYAAMRNNIVELMVDPLTPLFGTMGLKAINNSMNRTMAAMFGKEGLMPDELIISVNDHAYYNGSLRPGQILRIMLNSVRIMRRMFTGAIERWTVSGHPDYVVTVKHWEAQPWQNFSTTQLLEAIRQLTEAAIDAYMILVSGIIPGAWISEALFTGAYNVLIKRRDDLPATTYLLGFDSAPIVAEKALYDLAQWIRQRPDLALQLSSTPTPEMVALLASDEVQANVNAEGWHEWRRRFQTYLKCYGHFIFNLDYSNPVSADDPAPVLQTLKMFISGQGTNPYTRQQIATERRERAMQTMFARLKGIRLRIFRKLLASAQRYAPLREDGLANLGLSYPLLRQMLRTVGDRLVEGGMIQVADDVFWLQQIEVVEAAAQLDQGKALSNLSVSVSQRKANHRALRRITPPKMLPQIKVFGIDLAELKSGRSRRKQGSTIKGVAASPGQVTATARVLHGPEDFAQMETGDVLVAPMTTPAWTPLFALAAAVVTDVGGPLSHGSIVAREYGIPAVLGTGVATERIRSGQLISVDGSTGMVSLSDNDSSEK